jgi:hypothetical protein
MGLALFVQNLIIGQVLFLQKHRHACESARNVFDCLPYQQCDWVIGAIAISNSRMILVDFSHGYLYSSILIITLIIIYLFTLLLYRSYYILSYYFLLLYTLLLLSLNITRVIY